jgi:synaptobrevin family protein YKT6
MFHAYGRSEGVCGIVITDIEYPTPVAHQVLSKVVDEFVSKYPRTAYASATKDSISQNGQLSFPELKDYIQKYQDPQQADSITKIQKELDETKIVLHKTIESVLERGEKIDTLVAKSDGLSAQSKMFYTQVRRRPINGTRSPLLMQTAGQEAELVLHRYVNSAPALAISSCYWAFIPGFYSRHK